jgi:hypothetical protein
MDTTTLVLMIIVIALAALVVWVVTQRAKFRKLQTRFGPEYERVLDQERNPLRAASLLEKRTKRVAKYNIQPLTVEQRDRCSRDWRAAQEHFVDDPREAVTQADALVDKALRTRGYPMGDFEQQADDLSVEYPHVVDNYRAAHLVARRVNEASTEDLRRAMQHYRNLLEHIIDGHVLETARHR